MNKPVTSPPTAGAPNHPAPDSAATSPLASLETLLAARPAAASPLAAPAQTGDARPRPLEVVQASAVRPPACPDLDADLLLVHAGTPEGALAQTWTRRVLDGARLHTARFQENVGEQVQLLLPQVVLIQFEAPVLDLATHLVERLRISHPHLPLVAVGCMKHPQATLAALRAGVQDFIDLDGNAQAAQQAVQELVRRTPATAQDGHDSAPLTAILSARAGLGSSLLATHLAWYLQQRIAGAGTAANATSGLDEGDAALETLLIDLGNPSGDDSLYLDVGNEFDFIEAVHNLRRFDRRMASAGLARHASGLRLLGLPRQPGRLREISYADVDLLVLRLRQYFTHVIADLGAVLQTSLATRVALRASQVWVVCDQSVTSVVSTAELLAQLSEQKIERGRVQLIVSRHDARVELDAQQIARQLQLPLLAVIPERRAALAQAINQGRLLPATLRREPYVQAVDQLAGQLLASQHGQHNKAGPPPPAGGGTGGLARFIQRLRS
ncbi:pilus assembly protein CpaE [Corticibacter populi]|uniref:Pilus assembly protein CpaE n=1 Tax=Corticibacter populi TaxID=1550736 RepID=A0A3M6QTE7_9BURK|nr:pilus assembly protein CpaE [Corticibacter populi]RMX06314.1 pilus assembly protein CpaE [Corticibacter populi]RZS32150.1 response regulator receiver protein [Corticibacter populi]